MKESNNSSGQDPKSAEPVQDHAWKLYEIISDMLQHYHSRWIDNYKVFLSFNSFLLPAATVILGYALKENQSELRLLVALLSVVGAIAAWQGKGLLKRIHLDTTLRFNQLRRLEQSMTTLPIKPFTEGYQYFFQKTPLPPISGDSSEVVNSQKSRGRQALKAYGTISYAILVAYVVLFCYSVWPFILLVLESFRTCR
jgi:hypothetical protein